VTGAGRRVRCSVAVDDDVQCRDSAVADRQRGRAVRRRTQQAHAHAH